MDEFWCDHMPEGLWEQPKTLDPGLAKRRGGVFLSGERGGWWRFFLIGKGGMAIRSWDHVGYHGVDMNGIWVGEGSTISSKSFGFNQPTTCCWKISWLHIWGTPKNLWAHCSWWDSLSQSQFFLGYTPNFDGFNPSFWWFDPSFSWFKPHFLWPAEIALAHLWEGKHQAHCGAELRQGAGCSPRSDDTGGHSRAGLGVWWAAQCTIRRALRWDLHLLAQTAGFVKIWMKLGGEF